MSKYLGLDLGTNSIGWAYIDLTRTEKRSLRRKHQRELMFSNKTTKKKATRLRIRTSIIDNIRIVVLTIITLTMFVFSLIFAEYWQLYLNLGIGGLISLLTFDDKKDKSL